MSHFAVLVVGENPETQLAPFQEELDIEWVDLTEEYRQKYENEKVKEFYCTSSSSWGFEITKELFDFIKKNKVGATTKYNVVKRGFRNYLTAGKKYKGYYLMVDNKRCKQDAWFEVESVVRTSHPDENICFEGEVMITVIAPPKQIRLKDKYPDYETYLQDWHGVQDTEKQGYWRNPKSKWDWHQLGGRWSGKIKLKEGKSGKIGEAGTFENETGIDQAKKGDIANLAELTAFAVLMDGEWHENGEMGWWGVTHDEKMSSKDWSAKVQEIIQGLPDETLISFYDCHI